MGEYILGCVDAWIKLWMYEFDIIIKFTYDIIFTHFKT